MVDCSLRGAIYHSRTRPCKEDSIRKTSADFSLTEDYGSRTEIVCLSNERPRSSRGVLSLIRTFRSLRPLPGTDTSLESRFRDTVRQLSLATQI